MTTNDMPRTPQSAEEEWLQLIYEQGGMRPTPSGSISITENGTHDVTSYASAEVAVPSSGFDYTGLSGVKFAYNTDTTIDLSTLDTSAFTSGQYMFYACSNLTSLDASGFDTSNMTNMSSMFFGCSSLTSLDISNFDTSSVTSLGLMFQNCQALTSVNLPEFDLSNVSAITGMFSKCAFTSLDLSTSFVDTSNVSLFNTFLSNCASLESVNLATFDTSSATTTSNFLSGCTNLTAVIWAIESTTVQPMPTAKSFDKVSNTVPTDMYIYVRSSLVNSYKSATNWSRYSSYIKPISDLPAELQTLYNIDPDDYQ